MVNCTATFNCSSHPMDIHASPATVVCAADPCTADECCTITPTALTCTSYDCSTHANDLTATPGQVTCSGSACTDTECCTVPPTPAAAAAAAAAAPATAAPATAAAPATVAADIATLKSDVSRMKITIENLKDDVTGLLTKSTETGSDAGDSGSVKDYFMSFFDDDKGDEDVTEGFSNKGNKCMILLLLVALLYFIYIDR
jgi:hypothetical protein